MSLSRAQFVERLTASGIFSAADVAEFERKVAAAREISDAQAYARLLVQHGKLTKYQAAALYQGKTKCLVLGNYVLLDKLGAGGMGQVFKALHRRMDRVVALKVLPAEATKSPENVKRFHREVKAAARLEHPNIVAAHDADEADGTHFLVMQYVEGKDLSALVKEHGPFAVTQAVECIRQAALGLAYAHKRGVIHRDIKPANLLLDSEGTVKILDMGLARLDGQLHDAASVAGLTQSGQVMGTVDYMSPEQAEETRGVDARADQYSLGCTLWVLLTGRPMFAGTTTIAKLMAHRTATIPSLRAARADVPEALEAVYKRMVAKEPDDRYKSMEEVIAALATCLGDAPPSSLDGPSSTDSRLTEFFQQIAGTKTAAPPKSVTAVDEETQQLQPAKQETGTEHRIVSPARSAAPPALSAQRSNVSRKPTEKLADKAQPAKAKRTFHPLALAAGLAIAGIGSMGLLLALVLWVVLPTNTESDVEPAPITPTVAGDGGNYALDFDGRSSYVEIPTLKLPNGPLTVEAWITPRKTEREAIFHGGGESFVSLHTFKDSLGFWREAPSYLKSVNHSRIQSGERQHVAGVWDGKVLRAFVNGQGVSPGKQVPPELAVSKMLAQAMIGGEHRDGKLTGLFDGQIDELRVSTNARYTSNFNIVAPFGRMQADEHTLALYHFDEGQGDVLVDSSANKHHGNIVGAKWVRVASGAGDDGQSMPRWALEFDGESSVEIPAAAWKNSAEFTLEAWCVDAGSDLGSVVVLSNQFGLFTKSGEVGATTWKAFVRDAATNKPAFLGSDADSFRSGVEQHVAAVFDDAGLRLYIDGKHAGALSSVKSFKQTPTRIQLGEQFKGRIQAVRISDKARYSANFQPLRRWQPDAATLALYHFDEGTGDVLRDSSGNNHHGRIVGPKWIAATRSTELAQRAEFGLEFDGATSYVEIPPLKTIEAQPVTIEAWIEPQLKPGQLGTLVQLAPAADRILHLRCDYKEGAVRAGFVFSDLEKYKSAFDVAPQPRLHLAAVWRGPTDYALFINGRRAANPTVREAALAVGRERDERTFLGKEFAPYQGVNERYWFAGRMDEVRISQAARYEANFTPAERFVEDEQTLALYHCDEGTGDVLRDSSGNNHHGKIVRAKWVKVDAPPPPPDFALEFNGKSLVEISSLERNAAEPLTIEAWVKDVAEHTGVIACIRGKCPAQMHVSSNLAGKYLLGGERLPDGKLWRGVSIVETINFASWTHCAYVIDERGVTLFVDGKKAGEIPKADYAPRWTAPYRAGASIGGDGEPGKPAWTLQGSVRELRFSNSARYDRDFTPQPRFSADAATLALYHFDEGQGEVLRDSSGNGHDGKIVGAKWVKLAPPPSQADSALEFTRHARVELPALPLAGLGEVCVEAWVVPQIVTPSEVAIIFNADNQASLKTNATGNWDVVFSNGKGEWHPLGSPQPKVNGRLAHVAGVLGSGRVQLYIDGKRVAYKPAPNFRLGDINKPAVIGGGWEGTIRQLRVSKVGCYNADFVPVGRLESDANTIALYRFEEGAGEVLRDSSGNNHHGKIVGAKWVRPSLSTPDSAENVDD